MSIPPTRVMRTAASRLWWYAVTALRKDVPLPTRLVCLDMLRINLDQLFSPPLLGKMWALVRDNIPYVVSYMRYLGYEISEPSLINEETEELIEEPTIGLERIIKWMRQEFKKKEKESITEYLDRVSHLAARLLAVYSLVTSEIM